MIVVPYVILLCNMLLLLSILLYYGMKFLDERNRNINSDSSITIIRQGGRTLL